MNTPKITLIGGPTALIEIAEFRFLTDPTFDEPGEYKLPRVTLTKTSRPALSLKQLGTIDAVLLSHDQHSDNLDNSGRAFLKQASRVLTTTSGAERLGGGGWLEHDLCHRRHGLVRRRRRGGAPLCQCCLIVWGLGAAPWTLSSHDRHQRCHRNRAGFSQCRDHSSSLRGMDPFQAERRRFAQGVLHAWLRIAPAVAGAWVRHHHRVRHKTS